MGRGRERYALFNQEFAEYLYFSSGGKGASGVAVLGDLHEFPIHPLELWGQICFQLAAQPVDMKQDIHNGFINVEVLYQVFLFGFNECLTLRI